MTITCKYFFRNHPVITAIQGLIRDEYKKLFIAILVHGSLATNEVIPYSDFDGLLLVKDKYKDSSQLKSIIKKMNKHIYQFDPLQHHGWFIIYENQLQNYPQTYFPYELFEYTKLIYPTKNIEFDIILPDSINYKKPFNKLAFALLKKLEANFRPSNIYQLKSLLSEFMLLPTLYTQAKNNRGIFKKFSFNLAREDFSKEEWEIMDIVSKIRMNWHYNLNKTQKIIMTQPNRIFRKLNKKIVAPKIPSDIKIHLNEVFYKKMYYLTKKMINSLEKT